MILKLPKLDDQLKAGLFVVGALALLSIMIVIMGRERQIFATQRKFHTTFRDVKGLVAGAPVRLGGITVGRIARIGFSDNIADKSVHVTLLINDEFVERIPLDSVVSIETQGLLGDRFVSITPGKEKAILTADANMMSSDPSDFAEVLSRAGKIVDNTVQISESINRFVARVESDTLNDFDKMIESIGAVSTQIEKGDSLVHRLVYSKKDGERILADVSEITKTVSEIVEKAETGQGLLHALIYDPRGSETVAAITTAASSFSSLAGVISELAREVKEGDGFAHQVIYQKGPAGFDEVVTKINSTVENLQRVSEALAQGDGTIGALLLDPQIYDNLVEITDEAKRSFILRQLIKSSLEK